MWSHYGARAVILETPRGVTFLVTLFNSLALVVVLLTFTKRDNELNITTLRKEAQRDNTHAGLLSVGQFFDLFAARKKLARRGVDSRFTFPLRVECEAKAGVIKIELIISYGDERAF